MDKSRIAYLVQKLRRNQASAEERDELESFWVLAQNDDSLLDRLTQQEKESIRLLMFQRIKFRIGRQESGKKQSPKGAFLTSWGLKIAASIALMVAVSAVWVFTNTATHSVREFRTGYGEHKTVSLPDGSTVVINGNSALRYDASWSEDRNREVWIEGEGFFDVTHARNDLKFVVHTEYDMDVQVLGTKFNVKARRGKTEVMLQEGKVQLNVEKTELKKTMMLQPGELATFEDRKLSKMTIKPVEYASWKENKLYFDQTPLRDIAPMLEDTYGTPVVFASEEIADRKLSGEISSDEAKDILSAIEESLDIRISYAGDTAIFR